MKRYLCIPLVLTFGVIAVAADEKAPLQNQSPETCRDLISAQSNSPDSLALNNWQKLKEALDAFLGKSLPEEELSLWFQRILTSAQPVDRLYVVHEKSSAEFHLNGQPGMIGAMISTTGDVQFGFIIEVAGGGLDFASMTTQALFKREVSDEVRAQFIENIRVRFPQDLVKNSSITNRFFAFYPHTLASLKEFRLLMAEADEIRATEFDTFSYSGIPFFETPIRVNVPLDIK